MVDAPEGSPTPSKEVMENEARLVDQAISMHASLRDWYGTLGTGLVVTVLVLSVIGLAFAFAGGEESVELLGLTARRTTWLGWLAIVTFSLTLVELVLNPRGAARRRGEAVGALVALKNEYRDARSDALNADVHALLSQRYREVTGRVPEIPNILFNPLKSAHLRKVEISRVLSEHPGMGALRARRIVRQRLP